MKRIVMAMVAALMLAACEKHEEVAQNEESKDTLQQMTIHFDFGPAMTRASLTELNLTDLWCFDYVGGELQNTIHQVSSEQGFGSLAMSLDYGEHTFYFVASRGADPVVDTDAKTIVWGVVRDTFHASLTLNVQPTSASSHSVSLARVVGRLRISATDVVPENAAKFTVTPSTWYHGLNYETGEAVSSSSTPISVNIPASYIGTTELMMSAYTFSGSSPWQTDVTVSLLASDESVIGSVTLPNVSIQRNHITVCSGGIVGAGRTITIGSEDEWVEDSPVNW